MAQLVEKHIIGRNHKYYSECDKLCFLSKNLYNYANYIVRQEFIKTSKEKENGLRKHANWINYYQLNRILIDEKQRDYVSLPRKVSNQTLILLDKNWKSFFRSIKDYNKNPNKYNGKPRLPKYLDKNIGRFVTVYEKGTISKRYLKHGIVKPSQTNIEIPTRKTNINVVRIVPRLDHYVIEIVYTISNKGKLKDNGRYASIDIGINNLATLTTNIEEVKPKIINGKPLKSINQYYNKELSKHKSILEKKNKKKSSFKTRKLTNKRNNKINDYLHKASRTIVSGLINDNINTLVIGKNTNWKQKTNIGKTNNQNFVSIPHSRFIEMLIYKCEIEGIQTILQEESYTSQASFLDLDVIPIYTENNNKDRHTYKFSGYRKHRGLYKSKKKNMFINADVNGSYNILRKAIPNAFADGIEGLAVNPEIIVISN